MSLCARQSSRLSGTTAVPGDKSISHRALLLAASAVGETAIEGLLEAEDVNATAGALTALGAAIDHRADRTCTVAGLGSGGLRTPDGVLDLGNSGTGARLLMGLVASQPIVATFTGDASLTRRPMGRVIDPLRGFGARISAREGGLLPVTIEGTGEPLPIVYESPVASAQVKSAVLLAGLSAPGETTVIEAVPTRDHTENMLAHFGATVRIDPTDEGGRRITIVGQPELTGRAIAVPGDPSSAAFPVVAATVIADSAVRIRGVGINPLRIGLYQTLIEMGADITFVDEREFADEPVADLVVGAGRLRAIDVPPRRAASMIDEYPILAVAAACARGTTTFRGVGELRVKESDRLAAIARGLDACGVTVSMAADELTIEGCDGPPPGGATVATELDHRIAMAFLVLGLVAREPVTIDDARPIATSFPNFVELMSGLGATLEAARAAA